ncbi:MAG: helix-turn-helix domain-containing protein [Bacillota bacterium]|nr:helix-turn-helix domain-containing protein [Bacillota bacterium]
MKKDYMEACMNATRQRIIQVIMIKKEATSAEIGEELTDIPRASLYRHIKVLLDAGIITVVKEEFKRGSTEKTYAIAPRMPYDDTNEDYNSLIQSALMGLQGEFCRYFNGENPDPQRDLLTVGSASLMMSDEEMMEFIKAYGELIQRYMPNKPTEGRKVRKVTIVVSPNA